jgi:hypothetical protein
LLLARPSPLQLKPDGLNLQGKIEASELREGIIRIEALSQVSKDPEDLSFNPFQLCHLCLPL